MTNPLTFIPQGWRVALYLVFAALGPVLIYTAAKGWTGEAEYALWVGLGTALGLVAASNVTLNTKADDTYELPHSGYDLEDETGLAGVQLIYVIAAVLVIVVCLILLF